MKSIMNTSVPKNYSGLDQDSFYKRATPEAPKFSTRVSVQIMEEFLDGDFVSDHRQKLKKV